MVNEEAVGAAGGHSKGRVCGGEGDERGRRERGALVNGGSAKMERRESEVERDADEK